MSKLTGKVRHRADWRGKLILQVEVELRYDDEHSFQPRFVNEWRDAKVSDMVIDVNNQNLIHKV